MLFLSGGGEQFVCCNVYTSVPGGGFPAGLWGVLSAAINNVMEIHQRDGSPFTPTCVAVNFDQYAARAKASAWAAER